MICHKHKCIYIHISKCAGSSIENAFGYFRNTPEALEAHRGWDSKRKLYLQHATPQQLLDLKLISSEQWDSYYKFVVVRNSWSKLLSDYFWVSKTHKIIDSFENFILKSGEFYDVLNNQDEPYYCGDHLTPQKDYFYLNNEPIDYDCVIDFDEIDLGFNKVIDDLNLPKNFFDRKDNIGVYKKQHYSNIYTRKNRILVEKLYGQDINFFNFSFERKSSHLWLINMFQGKTL